MYRQTIPVGIFIILFASLVRADAVDDLKAANQAAIKAWNSLDLDAIMAGWHSEAVGFWATDKSPLIPARNRESFLDGMKVWINEREEYHAELVNPEYRVVGNTGVVCGIWRYSYKLKGQPRQPVRTQRYVVTYTKQDGKWLQLAFHLSRPPE